MGSRYHRPRVSVAATPILNRVGEIVGWTQEAPTITSEGRIKHPHAEALLRGPVTCTYIQIVDRIHATQAGAPDYWAEPWRCLAIIPTESENFSN